MSVGQDASLEPSTAELKEQGNLEYKNGNYLKAAALYAKAIKLLPNSSLPAEEQAVFYRSGWLSAVACGRCCPAGSRPLTAGLSLVYCPCSNRSAALLQINKVSKALADAEECTKLRPEWDKGFYRRAAALERLERFEEVGSVSILGAAGSKSSSYRVIMLAAGAAPQGFQHRVYLSTLR
jgi:tetratricopeptide (TPR) repeat protein